MSKLGELINKLCPDGVIQKKLKEIALLKRGEALTKSKSISGDVPVISGGKEPAFYCNTFNRNGENITVAGSGAGAGYVQYWNTPIFASDCFTVTGLEIIETKFLYYFMSNIQDKIYSTKMGGGVPHVHISDIENFDVPVPPIKIQREIIRILDNFTELTAELTVELTARKIQCEYYRNKLLSQENNVKIVMLSEVAKIKHGKDYKHLSDGLYPVYGSGGIMGHVSNYAYNKPSVLIPRKGSLENLFYVDKPFWNVDTIYYTEIDENIIIPKYLYYLLRKEQLNKLNHAGGVPSLTMNVLNKIELSVPGITIQKKIVDVLDHFEKICSDLNIGLPAEIESRQKQYEFYRDQLLTFVQTGHSILTDRQTDRQTESN